MPDIKPYTDQISQAVYGEEVRSSIINALNKVNDDNNSYQSIKEQIIEAKDDVDAQVAVFDEKAAAAQEIYDDLTDVTEEAGTAKTALDSTVTTANTVLDQLESENNDAETNVSALGTANTTAATTKTQLDQSVSDASDILSDITQANTQAQTNITTLTTTAQAAQTAAENALDTAETVEADMTQYLADVATAKQEVITNAQAVASDKADVQTLAQAVATNKGAVDTAAAQVAANAQTAQTAATSAQSSATSAAQSATAASGSATAAATSETNAAASATSAEASATTAGTSATSAANSAASSAQSAEDAEFYAERCDSYSKAEIDAKIEEINPLPEGGTAGQYLAKAQTGTQWVTPIDAYTKAEVDDLLEDVSGLPDGGTVGQVITKTASGADWQTPTDAYTKAEINAKETTINNAIASANTAIATKITTPATAGTEGQVLTIGDDGIEWSTPTDAYTKSEINAKEAALSARISTNADDIDALESDMATAQSDITEVAADVLTNAGNITSLQTTVAGKITSPATPGTEGQVLTIDSNQNIVWSDPTGGGGDLLVIRAQYPAAMAGYIMTATPAHGNAKTATIGNDGVATVRFSEGDTYTISDNLSSATQTVQAAYIGTYEVTVFRHVITVTVPASFVGTTLTMTGGETKTVDSNCVVKFAASEAGTYTITGTNISSKTYSTDVTVSASGATSVNLGFFSATIAVTYPEGSVCTCTDGATTITASDTTGTYTFNISDYGTYTVACTSGTESSNKQVVIDTDGQAETVKLAYVTIYGIKRELNSSSTAWTRTDASANFTATASVGTSAGASDFDGYYPWSDMTRHTLATNDVMVYIPEFYYQRSQDATYEYIRIADKETDGFVKHPGSDCYVGAYKTSSNNKSVTNASPTVNVTRATMRTNAKNKGTGWSLIDLTAVSAVSMLILVEFANNDVQSVIGRGYVDSNSSARTTGSCDSVANLTGRASGTDGKVDVVYRGIEGFWGNCYEFVDGLNINGDNLYVCNNPENYADDTNTNYTLLTYNLSACTSSEFISRMGCDSSNSWVILPVATGGSETTYYADKMYKNTGWRIFIRGGSSSHGSVAGLFSSLMHDDSSAAAGSLGGRLLYRPS